MIEFKQRILGEIQYIIDEEGTAEERERSLLKHMETVREKEFSVSPWKNYYLEQLITLAEQKGVAVFICLPPVRREIYEDKAGKEYLQSNKAFIENVCRSHDNVGLIRLTMTKYVTHATILVSLVIVQALNHIESN